MNRSTAQLFAGLGAAVGRGWLARLVSRPCAHAFANPARFPAIARPLTGWLGWVGALLVVTGLGAGLFLTPSDYLQGETVRILYVHVPTAWLGMAGWGGIAIASIMELVWRHPLAGIGTLALTLASLVQMRRAERAVDGLKRQGSTG